MAIHHWTLEQAGDLAECYNQQVVGLPYCWPQTAESFGRGIQEDLQELYGSPRDLHSEEMIVAEAAGSVEGFLHVGVLEKEKDGQSSKTGIIRYLCYEPGKRSVGQALLDEAEHQFREWGASAVKAFSKGHIYHFCSPDGGCSELSAHIGSLLALNGYETGTRTVNMVREDLSVPEPAQPDPGIRVEVAGETRRSRLPEVMVNASTADDSNLGMCLSYPLEYVQSTKSAEDQMYINWLAVEREFQGKGWGAYLLLRTLWEAQKLGYRHSILGTDGKNHKAQLFYANYGYRTTYSSYSYRKSLSD
jgi:ribosomal protein S18 acetylase RimI-like enzyme